MDFGLFDSIRDQKSITADDQEAFYQMLAAVGRAKPDQLIRAAIENLPTLPEDDRWVDRVGEERYAVAPLFNQAAAERGKLVELLGTARRTEKIMVDDPGYRGPLRHRPLLSGFVVYGRLGGQSADVLHP